MPDDPAGIRALAINQWAARVRFRETIERAYDDGISIFVECGPRNNLSAFVDDILKRRPHLAVPLDVEHRDGITQANHLIAQLAVEGVAMDFSGFYPAAAAHVPGGDVSQARRPMVLKTGLQPMRLPPQPARPAAVLPARPMPVLPAAVAAAVAVPAVAPVFARDPQPAIPVPAMATASQPAPLPADETENVLGAYFQTMQRFLHSQQEVMQSFLASEAAPAGEPTQADDPHGRLAGAPERFPLLHGATLREAAGTFTATVTIDLWDSPYLEDHTIGRDIATVDPALRPLAVVPLTFSMELMAEAAALATGRGISGMREVRGQRWVGLDDAAIALEILVRTTPQCGADEMHVLVRPAALPDGVTRLQPAFIEGIMVLGPLTPAPAVQPWQYRGARPARWQPAEIYSEVMFHGPRLRAIKSMDLWAEDGSEGTLLGMPHDQLFAWTTRPQFFTDAISLDAAGQVIGMWTSDHLARAFHVFPFRMERLTIFSANLAPGETATCRAQVALVGDVEVRSDIEIIGTDGRLRCRIDGWWDRRFDLPDRFFRLRRAPAENFLSRALAGTAAGLAVTMIDDMPLDFMESSGRIWMRVLAKLALTASELAAWQALPPSGAARAAWLLGRVGAKDAVRHLLRHAGVEKTCLADVDAQAAHWPTGWGAPPRTAFFCDGRRAGRRRGRVACAVRGGRHRGRPRCRWAGVPGRRPGAGMRRGVAGRAARPRRTPKNRPPGWTGNCNVRRRHIRRDDIPGQRGAGGRRCDPGCVTAMKEGQ